MISHFGKHLGLAALLFIVAACGGGKKSTTGESVDFGTDYTDYSTSGTSTLGTIPTLYDSTTTSDPLPQTGTAVNYGPISQTENLCLSSDSLLFNQFNPLATSTTSSLSPTACYGSQNFITLEDLYAFGIGMWGTEAECLNAALSLEPKTENPQEAFIKSRLAEMMVLRCVRHGYRSQWAQTQWSPTQNQNFAAGDNMFYSWLTKVGNSMMGQPLY